MEFDYVIVGAGSAGCVLANRLSANGRHSVAVLEAGGRDNYPWIHVPVGYFKTMGNPRTDWCYSTEKDPGLGGRSIKWPRGRVLGGSSSINGLLYVRGQPLDYDNWRQMGNAGWSWDDVKPYFQRAEKWEGGADDVRGGAGPLSVSRTRVTRPIIDDWMTAAVNEGYQRAADYNGKDQEGVAYYQMTTRNGRRCSSAVAYLRPAQDRQNLSIITNAQAEHLTFKDGKVSGVQALVDGQSRFIAARKEVVLSAGAIGSPQLLMLSGIGPAEHLAEHGIPVVQNLDGVGQNLQDHLQARPVFKCTASTINIETNSIFKQALIGLQYIVNRSGPMTMAASLGAAFLKTRPELETPDIQFHVQPFSADRIDEGPHPFSAFTASVLQLRPESVGELHLKSANPLDHPVINPNYLATRTDQETIVEGIRIARRIARQAPLRDLITSEFAPGSAIVNEDYDALLEWARETATTIYHPTGTCKMGQDPRAVVDNELRVHGVPNLRVADCSIMPQIVSGNTNAPAIMIGEKASDLVLAAAG
jgi:choline dehydrogenase